MLRYTQRLSARQLCRLILALALASIPLADLATPRTSILIPLCASLVPFDTSIQSPPPAPAQFSIAAPSVKRIALAWNANAFPMPPRDALISHRTPDSRRHCGMVALASARSPPPA
jgi:hypothetical protein